MSDREFSRVDRVAATMQRVLAGPISEIARNQGAGLVTITAIDLAPDLRRATVALSIYGDSDKRAFVRELSAAATDLQRILGRQLRAKRTPVLTFRIDDGIERGDRIKRLLDGARPDAGGD